MVSSHTSYWKIDTLLDLDEDLQIHVSCMPVISSVWADRKNDHNILYFTCDALVSEEDIEGWANVALGGHLGVQRMDKDTFYRAAQEFDRAQRAAEDRETLQSLKKKVAELENALHRFSQPAEYSILL